MFEVDMQRWGGGVVKLVIEEVDYHRNGVGGIGFWVVKFSEPAEERRMLAVVFGNGEDVKADGYCAVFNRSLLAQDNITFGENSWRGDVYETPLRRAIKRWSDEKWDAVLEAAKPRTPGDG